MSDVIVLSGGAESAFHSVDVQLGDNYVTLRISYVTSAAAWAMDVLQEGEPLFAGVMLRSNANMLESWGVTETFGAMTLIGDEPTIDNLGASNLLVWSSPDEL